MMAEPCTMAYLAGLFARAYLRLDSRRISAHGGHQGRESADYGQAGLDVPGEQSDESSVFNRRRSS